jgi:uncharacterized protein (TIGR03546 family)
MIFNAIVKLIIAINANTKPAQISVGLAFGLLLALIPGSNLLWVALFVLTFFIKLNSTVELLCIALFKLLVPLAEGPLNSLGYLIVGIPALDGPFTFFCNTPVLAFFKLNNTLVAGGLTAGLILFTPAFFLGNLLVNLYRNKVRDRLGQTKFMKRLLMLPLVGKLAGAVAKASGLYSH